MNFFLVKIDQFIGGYDPIETIHLIATDLDIQEAHIDLLTGLWIDRDKEVYNNYVEFLGIDVRCELAEIQKIDEQTFDLLRELGL